MLHFNIKLFIGVKFDFSILIVNGRGRLVVELPYSVQIAATLRHSSINHCKKPNNMMNKVYAYYKCMLNHFGVVYMGVNELRPRQAVA